MIGRLSLTWLWPILCLLALPSAQAGATRVANDASPALVSSAASGSHCAQDVWDVRYHSASRSTRRFILPSTSDDTSPALHLFQLEVPRGENAFCSPVNSEAGLELASMWQFLWRTALSPRAPSLVS